MRAWLITWEWIGPFIERRTKVAAILNSRFSGKRVKDIVEVLYANEYLSLQECMMIAKSPRKNPFSATFGRLDGSPWEGRIYCGRSPHLYARIVDGLELRISDGVEQLTWREVPRPSLAARP